MKNFFFLLFCLMAYPLSIEAQNRITLQHNGQSSFFTSLETAYTAAVDGDTIHLPGGTFAFPNNTMAKRLAIIGVGIVQDSSRATGISILSGLIITSASSGGMITGLLLPNGITVGSNESNRVVNGFEIIKCDIQREINFYGSTSSTSEPNPSKNFVIHGCIMRGSWCFNTPCSHGYAIGNPGGLSNFLFSNNLVLSGMIHINQSEISNNIIWGTCPGCYDPPAQGAGGGSTIKNNIFGFGVHFSKYFGIYYNNYSVQLRPNEFPNAQGANNYPPNIAFDSLFINASRSDYHLRPTYQTTLIGTDGTQIGIYGGRFPWKDGSMPFNPHISTFNVDPQTDNLGRLRLRANLNAQRN